MVLKYYADIKDIQADIKTEKKLTALSDSSWQDYLDTVRSTGAYMIFYQVRPIDHDTHVTIPVAQ